MRSCEMILMRSALRLRASAVSSSIYDAVLEVEQSFEEVDELAVAFCVEAEGEGIDGEVASVEVIVERAVLHDGLPAVSLIAFAPCADELNLLVVPLELCCAEATVDADVSAAPHVFGKGLGEADART